jgi:uncharacterized protein YndB with AHSA1/START domain
MENKLIAKTSISIAAPIEMVWNALVDPKVIKQYMFGTEVVSEWKAGSKIVWKGEWNGKSYEDIGKIIRMEQNKLLEYSHFSLLSGQTDAQENYHIVTIELAERKERTELSLSQNNVANLTELDESTKNWEMMLQGIKKLLEEEHTQE